MVRARSPTTCVGTCFWLHSNDVFTCWLLRVFKYVHVYCFTFCFFTLLLNDSPLCTQFCQRRCPSCVVASTGTCISRMVSRPSHPGYDVQRVGHKSKPGAFGDSERWVNRCIRAYQLGINFFTFWLYVSKLSCWLVYFDLLCLLLWASESIRHNHKILTL